MVQMQEPEIFANAGKESKSVVQKNARSVSESS